MGEPGINVVDWENWYNCRTGVVACDSPAFGVPGLDLDFDLDLDLKPVGLVPLELQQDLFGLCGRDDDGDVGRDRFLS